MNLKLRDFLYFDNESLEFIGVETGRPFGRYFRLCVNVTSCGIFALAIFLMLDHLISEGGLRKEFLVPVLRIGFTDTPLEVSAMQLLYYLSTAWAIFNGLFFAAICYLLDGDRVSSIDINTGNSASVPVIARLQGLFTGLLGAIVFFLCGYILSIPAVFATPLSEIPGIELLQTVVAAKCLSAVSGAVYQAASALIPHALHPKMLFKK